MPAPIVEAVGVSKRFGGVQALTDVSVTFGPGEVHCIVGENGCGKSTLLKVISGAYRPTSGQVVVAGTAYDHLTPRQALSAGIEVIYQDFSLMPNLTAAENIALPGSVAGGRRLYSRTAARTLAERAVVRLGVEIELDIPVGELTVAERQLTAIARALAHEAKFIAMDEPTTALTWKEVDALFAAVGRLKEAGVALAFISHKMQEIFSIAERVTVLRNGSVVTSGRPDEFTHASLAETMTGRGSQSFDRVAPRNKGRAPALKVKGLGREPLFADVDLEIGRGEIVGLAGLLGSGRTEIAEAICGVKPAQTGTIEVLGRPVEIKALGDAVKAGIGYVPEDRLTQGLFLDQPIGDNIVATHLPARRGFLRSQAIERRKTQVVRDLRIKLGKLTDPVRSLSGGNAQRVLLGKWLVGEPKVLILNGPTVGVDVGSKFDILGVLNAQSLQGLGVLIISDDVPELISMCHRILVVRSGRIVRELTGDQLREDTVIEAVTAS
ncbi:sugar ABC transporter ATP-binding protein [Kribbella sp. NPDC058245]|uniref:sugar ABC transporter ATP-binding protein n=1 Tax=Kribbella sp. NPDC058245 TaxID=3346399 RepID=UPI0036E33C14